MTYQLKHTEPFELATGISYATIFKLINAELIRLGFDIDTTEWGYSLPKLLNCLDTSCHGFLVCAFADYPDVTMEQLALLTDCVIMGYGNCPDCGDELEFFETESRRAGEVCNIVKCRNCGYTTKEWFYEDQIS